MVCTPIEDALRDRRAIHKQKILYFDKFNKFDKKLNKFLDHNFEFFTDAREVSVKNNFEVHFMKNFTVTPTFQQVFFTVVCFTFLSGTVSIWLSSKSNLSPQQTRVFETCTNTWNMGVGAIFGLLGSKATDLFASKQEEENEE